MATHLDLASPGETLERLYREFRVPLCGYIRRRFGAGPPEPEDIAQEAFARLATQHAAEVANPRAFLLLTARNCAIDARRKHARGTVVLDSVAAFAAGHQALDPATTAETRDELRRLAAAVDTLTPKPRAAFLLHRIDGLSFAEIARQLGISQSGARLLVETALAHCVKRMR